MRRQIVLALLVSVVILTSGCTQQREIKIDTNNGLVINEFSTDWDRVDEGDWVNLYLEIENVGGTTAKDVSILFFGATGWKSIRDTYVSLGDLDPPDLSMNTPGDFTTYTLDIQAPDLLEGIEQSYDIYARVKFDYTTTAMSKIPVVNENEAKRKMHQGEILDTSIEVTNSEAPIKIRVDGASPIVAKDDPEIANYRFIFENVGDGVPINDAQEIGPVHVKITTDNPGVKFEDCLGKSGNSIDAIVLLRKGDKVTTACTLVVHKSIVSQKPQEQIVIKFKADYSYFIQDSVSITVVGAK